MEYELRWGRNTWFVALIVSGIIGVSILLMSYWGMGETWHGLYYVPLLGYYVMLSICQSHYFKIKPVPSWNGLARQWVSITGAVFIFYGHIFLMKDVIGIPPSLIMTSQFMFILLGFFFFGMDDFMFKGQLSKWLKHDALKAIFWYAIVWVVWFFIFAFSWGLSGALGDFNGDRCLWFMGSFQWVIMMSMMIAITWKDYLDTVKFRSNYDRGIKLLTFSLVAGFAIGFMCYQIVSFLGPEIPEADKWHHVLYMGTYPLIPIILFGLYSNHFNDIRDVKRKTQYRTLWIAGWVIAGWLIFRLVISQTGIFGEHVWWHHFDLVFNFTVSIIALSHHWFCGRVGFMKEKSCCCCHCDD
ncbi:MAG: hypothetical protein PHU53_03665 [Thermoplasmata archaeon]|nr:hypothetical protein [Thermoplasmata archaeon]